jgi:hypothetical protein
MIFLADLQLAFKRYSQNLLKVIPYLSKTFPQNNQINYNYSKMKEEQNINLEMQ